MNTNSKDMKAAVVEINAIPGWTEQYDFEADGADIEKMEAFLRKAMKELEASDKLSGRTVKVLKELGCEIEFVGGKTTSAKTEPSTKKTEKKAAGGKGKKEGIKEGIKKAGVIQKIFDLVKDGPITKEKILAQLVKSFPDRQESGMRKTIQVQLPGRMSREKKVKIEETEKGFQIKG